MLTTSRAGWVAVVLVAVVLVSACGDDNPIGPSNQPQIGNNTDNFQFQASNLTRTTQTLTYSWVNTGTAANVDQSGSINSGDATIILRDAANVQVYSGDLKNTGSFASSTGASGTWRIEVRLNDLTGTLNFRVQKRS